MCAYLRALSGKTTRSMFRISFRKEVRPPVRGGEGGREIPALAAPYSPPPTSRITQLSSRSTTSVCRTRISITQAQDTPIAPLMRVGGAQDRFTGVSVARHMWWNPRVMCRVMTGERDAVASIPRSGCIVICPGGGWRDPFLGQSVASRWPASPEQYREICQQSIT